jgi:chromosomal replication initiation ATPase DnaA
MMDPDNIAVILPPAVEQHMRDLFFDDEAVNRVINYLMLCRPTMAEIKEAVCNLYCIEPHVLAAHGRSRSIARARQVFCYLACRYTGFSLRVIGRQVGLADHSTVRHAVHNIDRLAYADDRLNNSLCVLRMNISEKVLSRCTRRV